MAMSNNFSDRYKTYSNIELISILDNQEDYQPLAIEAAKDELNKRQLSETEIREASQLITAKKLQQEKEREKIKAVETKIKAAGNSVIDTLNPVQSGISSTEKTIRFIVIVYGLIFLYQLISDFRAHLAIANNFSLLPVASIAHLLPLILLPVALFTFWNRKTIGWILLTIFVTYATVGEIWWLLEIINWESTYLAYLSPRPSPLTSIFQLFFFLGTLYAMCKASTRQVFAVDKLKAVATIAITLIVTTILIISTS